MKKISKILLLLLVVGFTTIFISCDNDEGPAALEINSITATGTDLQSGSTVDKDLNAATAASDVPVDLEIKIVFSRNVDPATVSSSSVTLSDADGEVSVSVSASGATVTITPDDGLKRGTDYTLAVAGSVKAEDGGVFTQISRTFSTGGRAEVTPPQDGTQVAYWKFDGDAEDAVGDNDASAVVDVTYNVDRFGQTGSAAYFDGDASIIEIPNGSSITNASQFTISFWIKTDTEGHTNADGNLTGMFVLGLGAFYGIQYEIFDNYDGSKFAISYENDEGETFGEDMWFPAEAQDNSNGGWQGWTYAKSLTPEQMQNILKDNWYHVVYTFDGSERVGSLYFDGELMKSFDFDLWPEGDTKQTGAALKYRGEEPDVVDELAFGFIQSRAGTLWDEEPWGGYDIPTSKHFKGWLDDIRIFHGALSDSEVEELYNAEAP